MAIIEAEVCPDHIHMLLEIPPKIAVSSFVGYLKGKSSLMIYEQFPNLKYKYRNREFWCRVYYVDTVGKNAKKIEEYIRNQLEEDRMGEQLTMGADVTATPPPVVLRIGAAGGIFMVSDETKRPDEAAMRRILDRYSDSPEGIILRLAWLEGLSRKELNELTWDQVDFETQNLLLQDRTIPLEPSVAECLQKRYEQYSTIFSPPPTASSSA